MYSPPISGQGDDGNRNCEFGACSLRSIHIPTWSRASYITSGNNIYCESLGVHVLTAEYETPHEGHGTFTYYSPMAYNTGDHWCFFRVSTFLMHLDFIKWHSVFVTAWDIRGVWP